jgi:hypothetical protein
MEARGMRPLTRRLRQAICGSLVGCVIALWGYGHLGEVICRRSTQSAPVSYPSIAVEGVLIIHLAKEIENKRTRSEADNFEWGYRSVWLVLVMSAPWSKFGKGSYLTAAPDGEGDGKRGLEWIFPNVGIPTYVPKLIGGRLAAILNSYQSFWTLNIGDPCDPEIVNKYIGAELPHFGILGNIGLSISGIYRLDGLQSRIYARSEKECGNNSINNSGLSSALGPFETFPILMLALCLCGLVCAFKGIDRDGDLLLFGGTVISSVSAIVLFCGGCSFT